MIIGLLLMVFSAFALLFIVVNYFVQRSDRKAMENRKWESSNPYIQMHKLKMKNEVHYDEYLKWAEKNAHGTPVAKYYFPGDEEAEKKIKNLIR